MSRPLEPTTFTRKSHSVIVSFALLPLLMMSPWTSRGRSLLPLRNQHEAQQVSTPEPLEPGKSIDRELSRGDVHSFLLKLTAGQYALVEIDQRHINVAIAVFDPDGKKIADQDTIRLGDPELITLLSDQPIIYRLEVRASEKTGAKGHYEIRIKELRAATSEDKSGVAAERLAAEGIQFDVQATAVSRRKAIDKYQQSLPLWHSAGNLVWEAGTLYLIGIDYMYLGEKQKALEAATQALTIAEDAVKRSINEEGRKNAIKVKANALETIGRIHSEFDDKNEALEFFKRALPLRDEAGDRVGKVGTLNSMATAYELMGEYQKASDLLDQMRSILADLGDREKEATFLNNICVTQQDLGAYRKALDFCNQSLSIRRELKDDWGEAIVLNSLGNTYSNLGEYQDALESYTKYYQISKKRGNEESEAIALNNIGWVYATLGDYQKAIDFYTQAQEIFRNRGDQYREVNVLNNIAVNYADMKDFRKALEINLRVLPLRGSNKQGKAITLNNLAGCYQNLGDKAKALDYYNQALAAHREIGNPRTLASTLRNIGTLYRDSGEYQKALDYFNEGLQLTRTAGDRNTEAGILSHIAKLERDRGNLVEARSRIEQALATVESLRINIQNYRLRSSFFASVRQYHELDIDLLMRLHQQHPGQGFDAAALQVSEKARARSLLELLSEANAEIRTDVDPALLERERNLRQLISERADRQARLFSTRQPDEAKGLAKELDHLTTEYEQVRAQIREASPRYAALTQPIPLSSKEIQTQVLDEDTLLLEYALGEEKSFLWAVTPTSIHSFELPKRGEVESAAKRAFETLTARNQRVTGETLEQHRLRVQQAEADYSKASTALSQILLGPVASELKKKRLVIVGEGVLQYVPFAALPTPVESGSGKLNNSNKPPLIVEHEIINLPSASVLAALKRDTAGRKPPDKTVAVFADPVFDSSDPRLRSQNKESAKVGVMFPDDVKRSASESGIQEFVRLRFTRQEADQIIRLAPENGKLEAIDFAANRMAALSPELGHYRILHFATHGLINNQHPELSGIVLSLVDRNGQPQNGFLRLYDIYNLRLQADLVVLSACQTAVGKDVKGEGLMGLTRGFMYAGAPRVVASLWQIEDRASAEFMGRFYESMLRHGLRPAAALRAAQVSMSQDKRWGSPYYWAAFTLQGEWK